MKLPLVPLRIPSGWMIIHNNFTESSPEFFVDKNYENRWEFIEDILQFKNENKKRILDLGWYPELEPEGEYCLILIKLVEEQEQPDYWDQPILKYRTKELKTIKDIIEDTLEKVNRGEL